MAYLKYSTVEKLKAYLGNNSLSVDQLQDLIDRGSRLLDAELGDNIGETSKTKRVDGYGKPRIIMENTVNSVESVKYIINKQYTEIAVDFIDGAIIHLDSIAPVGERNIEVKYTK